MFNRVSLGSNFSLIAMQELLIEMVFRNLMDKETCRVFPRAQFLPKFIKVLKSVEQQFIFKNT